MHCKLHLNEKLFLLSIVSKIKYLMVKCKLGIEVYEYNHEGRNSNYEKSRQLMIERHEIAIIRTNPHTADFDMNRLINQIYTRIIESTKVSTQESLIDDLSKGLLELEFKSNYSIKSKRLK